MNTAITVIIFIVSFLPSGHVHQRLPPPTSHTSPPRTSPPSFPHWPRRVCQRSQWWWCREILLQWRSEDLHQHIPENAQPESFLQRRRDYHSVQHWHRLLGDTFVMTSDRVDRWDVVYIFIFDHLLCFSLRILPLNDGSYLRLNLRNSWDVKSLVV